MNLHLEAPRGVVLLKVWTIRAKRVMIVFFQVTLDSLERNTSLIPSVEERQATAMFQYQAADSLPVFRTSNA